MMQDGPNQETTTGKKQAKRVGWSVRSLIWPTAMGIVLGLLAGTVAHSLANDPRYEAFLNFAGGAAGVGAAVLALRLIFRISPDSAAMSKALKELLDSAGPMVMAAGLNGRFIYLNPATERLLGYRASELLKMSDAGQILPPGEGERLVSEMLKLCGVAMPPDMSPESRLAAYVSSIRAFPPNQVPSFYTHLRHKNDTLIPVALHISVLRDDNGVLSGLVAVALDQTAALRQEEALHESQDRYRDLFESSSEMIATLSPSGQFLYANPAWKLCFGKNHAELLSLNSFEELFGPACRGEVAALFRRALDGEVVDRAPLRHYTHDGRVLELELSLSQRQRAGNPLALRCLLRDVTQQKQREYRLALQLVVNQIVG